MLFAPSHLMAIMTLGINSALVMDCGYTETLVLPVSFYCSRGGTPKSKSWPLGHELFTVRVDKNDYYKYRYMKQSFARRKHKKTQYLE